MPATKPVFLLANAVGIPFSGLKGSYDPVRQLTILEDGSAQPLVMAGGRSLTHSKTMRAPGDDDPDARRAECY